MDMKQIKSLMNEFDSSTLSSLKINKEGFSIELEKATIAPTYAAPAAIAAAPVQAAAPTAAAVEELSGDKILSPMVGTYYSAPSPDSPAFVKEGNVVKKGQPLGILEAMKIMNELEAEFDCKILKILVQDGSPVEYDMPLFLVEKM
jgi:acetyl-CoA carboxylase biotin carboxyl carrier protein